MDKGKYTLSVSRGGGSLRLTLSGRIDTTNVRNFEDEVRAERAARPGGEIIFDCGGLDYISSAGLRVFLTLVKKEQKPVRLINVSQDVYETLDITGFTQLLDVSRAVKDVSEEPVRKIGYSGGVTVYIMGEDTLLKVYPEGTLLETVEKERRYAQAAFLSGVPTLIPYDVVTYNGNYGMLYEFLKSHTVASLVEVAPMKLYQYAKEMGTFLRTLHSCEPEPGVLPRTKDLYASWVEGMAARYLPREMDTLRQMALAIPEAGTFVCGSYDARNVFVQRGELMLINMLGSSCGSPVCDLGTTYLRHVMLPDALAKQLTGLENTVQRQKFWMLLMRAYFDTDDERVLREHEPAIRALALLRAAIAPAIAPLPEETAEACVVLARRDLFPAAQKLMSQLIQARF